MADDLGNLDIQRQINELLSDRSGIYAKHSEMLKGQAQLALNIAELLGRDTSGYRTSIEEASTALDAAADAAERAAAGTEGMGGSAAKAGKEVEKTSNTVIKFGNIAKKTFGWFKNTIGVIVDIVATLGTGISGIADAILKTPLKILGVFQEQARKLAEDSLALREAFEEIRDKFGDLSSNEGKSVTDAFKNMRAESGNLAGSGRSLSSVFGYGPQGLAAALKYAGEVASALGPTLNTLGQQFEDNAASITMMAKGLDLSNEAIGALGTQAKARGEDLNDSFKEIGNLSVQMGKKFGISSKEMGRSMSYMTANMGKFGSMTKAQMATAAVYTKKLGLEIKDLEGVMGAFDDFETAATNASKLSQAFGMNVDAMEMMKEQDPAKRLDMLRKAFAATGKSIESMNRQEKVMLAQTAGLPENMVEASLSAKNMGLSYEEVAAAAEGAADKQLTQEEIMQDMAKNIKKVFAPLQYVAGLLENFMNGFVTGIMRSKPAMALLQAIMRVIQELYHAGLDLGKMFVDVFPGVKQMFNGVTDIFNNLRGSIKDIKKAFIDFFKGVSEDPVAATEKLMKVLQEKFFDLFDPKKGGGKFIDGLKTFGLTIVKVLFGFGKWFLDAVIQGSKNFLDYLKNPTNITSGAITGFQAFFQDIWNYLSIAIPDMWNTFVDILYAASPIVWDWIKEKLTQLWSSNLGKAIIAGVALFVAGPYLKQFAAMLFGGLSDSIESETGGGSGISSVIQSLFKGLSEMSISDMAKLGALAYAVTYFLENHMDPLAEAFANASNKLKDTNWSDLGKTIAVLGAAVFSMYGLGKTIQAVGEMDWESLGKSLLIGLVAFITTSLINTENPTEGLIGAFKTIIESIGSIDTTVMIKGIIMLGAMLASLYGLVEIISKLNSMVDTLVDLALLGAVTQFLDWSVTFINQSLTKFAGAVRNAAAIADQISLESIGKLALVIGLVGLTAAVLAGSSVAGALGGAAAAFGQGGIKGAVSWLWGGGGKEAEKAPDIFDKISNLLSNVNGPLINIIKKIEEVAGSITNPDKIKTSIEIIAGVFSAFGPILDVLKMASDLAVKSAGENVGEISTKLSTIMTSMNRFVNKTLDSMVSTVTSLLGVVSGINVSKEQANKVKIFGDVINAFSTFMGAVISPLSALGSLNFDGESVNKVSEIFDKFKTAFFGNAVPPTQDTTSFMYKLTSVLPQLIKSIDSAFSGKGIKEIKATGERAKTLVDVVDAFKSLSEIFSTIGASGSGPLMPTTIDGFLGDLESNLFSLSLSLPFLAEVSNDIKSYRFGTIANVITQISEDIQAVNEALGDLGEIKMDATIEKVGKALGIKDTVIQLERKPIQMNVQLNLTMKAEDIAKEIFDVAYKTVYPGEGTSTATAGMTEAYRGSSPPPK